MTERVRKVCATCGSTDVQADAFAGWNEDEQRWEVVSVMDNGHSCEECADECEIEDEPIDD